MLYQQGRVSSATAAAPRKVPCSQPCEMDNDFAEACSDRTCVCHGQAYTCNCAFAFYPGVRQTNLHSDALMPIAPSVENQMACDALESYLTRYESIHTPSRRMSGLWEGNLRPCRLFAEERRDRLRIWNPCVVVRFAMESQAPVLGLQGSDAMLSVSADSHRPDGSGKYHAYASSQAQWQGVDVADASSWLRSRQKLSPHGQPAVRRSQTRPAWPECADLTEARLCLSLNH